MESRQGVMDGFEKCRYVINFVFQKNFGYSVEIGLEGVGESMYNSVGRDAGQRVFKRLDLGFGNLDKVEYLGKCNIIYVIGNKRKYIYGLFLFFVIYF